MPLPETTPVTHRTVVDKYKDRKSTVITVRTACTLKERIDNRLRKEAAAGFDVSMNKLITHAIIAYLDHLDSITEHHPVQERSPAG